MLIAATFGIGLLCAAIVLGTVFAILKKRASSGASRRDELVAKVITVNTAIDEKLKFVGSYASKGQLESLTRQIEESKVELSNQKDSLKEIETKLDLAQKTVETKETEQQDIKAAREEDENALKELLGRYGDISTESITLEQKLAASLKNIDQVLDELNLTTEQRALLTDLQETLTDAGSRLRDLLTEYQTVNERLEALRTQHVELEEEYTKLVEQQLGE